MTATDSRPTDAPTHDEFRAAAADFLAESVAAGVHCPGFGAIMLPALHDRARAWQRRVFEAGFAGIHWPVEYGGRGLDRSYTAIWSEECAKAGAAVPEPPGPDPGRRGDPAQRHARAEGDIPAAHLVGRDPVVPVVLRARRRVRSREPESDGGA
ncbi:MAG: acyl-CoA dehydrogenase family protein [Ilumatobacteraceae bacterium]